MSLKLAIKPVCPKCQTTLDGVTQTDSDDGSTCMPVPGDVTVCFYCAALLLFQGRGGEVASLRELRSDELMSMEFPVRASLIRTKDFIMRRLHEKSRQHES